MLKPLLAAASAVTLFTAFASAQAPIERPAYHADAQVGQSAARTRVLRPAHGVQVLIDGQLTTVTSSATRLELRLDSGRANVSVDHPAEGMLILVDLPGGQADLVRDGFYTFNAATNQVAVLHGEAVAFAPDAPPSAVGKTIRQMQGAVLGSNVHPEELQQAAAETDLLQPPAGYGAAYANNDRGEGGGWGVDDGFYDDFGPYPYPYYGGLGFYGGGWGYPWGWSYGWGYPIGFGYGGYWGGYRGGYYGGYGGYRGGLPNHGFHGYAAGGHVGGFSGGHVSGGGGFSGGHR